MSEGKHAIQEGTVVKVHSLKSPSGQRINGSRALVIRYRPEEERFEVRIELEESNNATKALKACNLQPLERLPIPTGPRRGLADIDVQGRDIVIHLCQLLLFDIPNEFSVSEIVFTGYASMAFHRMDQRQNRSSRSNFDCFFATQMEQMGGVLGLGNLCHQTEEEGTAAVVFALLEGDEMYVDTLIQTMACTGEIIDGDNTDKDYDGRDEFLKEGMNGPCLSRLTPDQDTAPYVRTMTEGPVLILECVSRYSFAPSLWSALSRSEFYHFLIQRLLRWSAREAKGTRDGSGIGKKARKLLGSMFPDIVSLVRQTVSGSVATNILEEAATVLSQPSQVTIDNLKDLLQDDA